MINWKKKLCDELLVEAKNLKTKLEKNKISVEQYEEDISELEKEKDELVNQYKERKAKLLKKLELFEAEKLYGTVMFLGRKLTVGLEEEMSFTSCIIITPIPFEKQFQFQKGEEFLDGFWIRCKLCRAELVALPELHSELPAYYVTFTPTNNNVVVKHSITARQISYILTIALGKMLSHYRTLLYHDIKKDNEKENEIQTQNFYIDKLEQRLIVEQRTRAKDLNKLSEEEIDDTWKNRFWGLAVFSAFLVGIVIMLIFKIKELGGLKV